METKPSIMSAAQVMEAISDLAKSGEGADRRWALKMLSAQSSTVGLPVPIDEEEATMRLARLMDGYGKDAASTAYRRAFHNRMQPGDPLYGGEDMARTINKELELGPTSLQQFYEMYPEERPKSYPAGYPKGYPYRGTVEDKHIWLLKRVKRIIINRKWNEDRRKRIARKKAEAEAAQLAKEHDKAELQAERGTAEPHEGTVFLAKEPAHREEGEPAGVQRSPAGDEGLPKEEAQVGLAERDPATPGSMP